jgi:hypothetical protein
MTKTLLFIKVLTSPTIDQALTESVLVPYTNLLSRPP